MLIVQPGWKDYAEKLDERLPLDPDASRSLLAEAGYPDGFSVTLDCPSNRYVNGEAVCRALATQLGAVGIEVSVNAIPRDRFWPKLSNAQTDFWLQAWATGTFDSQETFLDLYHSRAGSAGSRAAGYVNPEVDELIEAIEGATITYGRDALIEKVWKIVLADVVYVPLYNPIVVWAMAADLDLPVNPANEPRFRNARLR
jgi:peptide/nickel transport system substrate-binding protein